MKTGIIMEIDGRFLTLLTPDGQFLRARNNRSHFQIGQEIQFIPIEEESTLAAKWTNWGRSFKGKALSAAVVAILIGVATFVPVYNQNQVYAYMSLDEESSIELEVNKQLEVIGINPYNEEGKEIVKNLGKWENQDLSTVSGKILSEMKKRGQANNEIILSSTVVSEKNKKADKLLQKEMSDIKSLAAKEEATITVVNGTKAERKEAKDKGVTVGNLKQEDKVKTEKQKKNKETKGQNKKEDKQTKVQPEKNQNAGTQPPAQNKTGVEKEKSNIGNGSGSKSDEVKKQKKTSDKQDIKNNKQKGKTDKQTGKDK